MKTCTALLMIALSLALAACGNKGPLMLATEPPPPESAPTRAGEVPVEAGTPSDAPLVAPAPGAPAAESATDAPATDAPTDVDPPADDGADD